MKTIEVRRSGQTRWIDADECEWLIKRDMLEPAQSSQNTVFYPARGQGLHVIDRQLTAYAIERALFWPVITQKGVELRVPGHMFVRLYDGSWVDLKDGKWVPNTSDLPSIKKQMDLWRNDKPMTHGVLMVDAETRQRLSVPQIIYLLNTKAIERHDTHPCEGYYHMAEGQNFAKIQASLESAGLALEFIGVDKPGSTLSAVQQVPEAWITVLDGAEELDVKGSAATMLIDRGLVVKCDDPNCAQYHPNDGQDLDTLQAAIKGHKPKTAERPSFEFTGVAKVEPQSVPEQGPCAIDMQLTQADFKHLYKVCGAQYGQNDNAGKTLQALGYLVQYCSGYKTCQIWRDGDEIAAYYTGYNGGHFLMHAVWSGSEWGTHS